MKAPFEAKERGLWAEEQVAVELRARGWRVIARRWRGPVAEIDLIARRTGEDALIEVKTISANAAFHSTRLTPRQLQRLIRARELWQARFGRPTRLLLAWVTPLGEIMLFNLPEGGLE